MRNKGLDYLRVISVILIVVGHMQSETFLTTVGFQESAGVFLCQTLLGNGERLAINCFVMISSWFLIGREFSGERFVKMWLRVFLVNVIITVVMVVSGQAPLESIYTLQAFFPIIGRPQWYMCEYLLLLLTYPLLNVLVDRITRRQHKTVLEIGLLFIVLIETVCIIPVSFSVPLFSEYIWFVYLYFCVAYIKKYTDSRISKLNGYKGLLLAIISYLFIVLLFVVSEFSQYALIKSAAAHFAVDYAALPGFLASLGLFQFFKKYEGDSRNIIVKKIAKNSGYIYMIHAVPVLWRFDYSIWENIFHISYWYEKGNFTGYLFVICIPVFVIVIGTLVGEILEVLISAIIKSTPVQKLAYRI